MDIGIMNISSLKSGSEVDSIKKKRSIEKDRNIK